MQVWYDVIEEVLVCLNSNTLTKPTVTKMNLSLMFHCPQRLRVSHRTVFVKVSWTSMLSAIVLIFSTGGLLIFRVRNFVLYNRLLVQNMHEHLIVPCINKTVRVITTSEE